MINFIKNIKIKKGFTLIELIVSIALLAIISISFLAMFLNGITGIINAGKKSTNHYNAQDEIEKNIDNSTETAGGAVSSNSCSITGMCFNGTYYPPVTGRKIDVTYVYGNSTKKITTFTTN